MKAARLLGPADYRRVPWRNGRGMTTEIAQEAGGAGGFLWRFSLAEVTEDGPFSGFPGCDRLIAVAQGRGMMLAVGGAAPVPLPLAGPAFAFPGEAPAICTLPAGPARAANLMTARGEATGGLVVLPAGAAHGADGDVLIVHALAGSMTVTVAGDAGFTVSAGMTALLRGATAHVVAGPQDHGLCATVRLLRSR